MGSPPPTDVLAAFGVAHGDVRPLSGGQRGSYLVAGLVLKRVDNESAARWCADLLAGVEPTPGFRVAKPAPSLRGEWVHRGWTAFEQVDGDHDFSGRWTDVLTTCRDFHRAIANFSRPVFLDERRDPWSIGDRVAWDGAAVVLPPLARHPVDDLLKLLAPISLPSQVIHGDFGGNVLFARNQAPAVIDFSPYWRPALFAEAVVIADAIAWHGAPLSLLQWFDDPQLGRQLILRASIYRLVTAGVAFPKDRQRLRSEIDAYHRALCADPPGTVPRGGTTTPQVT